MESLTSLVAHMPDPFTVNTSSPASAPTPSRSTHQNFIGPRHHHSTNSSPTPRHHAFTDPEPSYLIQASNAQHPDHNALTHASIIEASLPKLSQTELMNIYLKAESCLRDIDQGIALKGHAVSDIGVSNIESLSITPSLSPNAGSSSAPSVSTPSPIRADRVGKEITNENAQGYYPASSCLYVGNLPTGMRDEEIRSLVHGAYSASHECYVTVSRDKRGLAGAFVQFTKKSDAQDALDHTATITIGGRQIRAERTKANFCLMATMIEGTALTDKEIIESLQELGPLEKAWRPSDTECTLYDLPSGCICFRFLHFADFQDVRSGAKTLSTIKIQSMTKYPTEPNAKNGSDHFKVSEQVRINDATSIFVGNLRRDCDISELYAVFGTVGKVINVQKHDCGKKCSQSGQQHTTPVNGHIPSKSSYFAFVEFREPQSVATAIKSLNGTMLRGYRMRVELRTDVKREVDHMRGSINAYIAKIVAQTGYCPDNAAILSAFPTLLGTSLALSIGKYCPRPASVAAVVPYYILLGV